MTRSGAKLGCALPWGVVSILVVTFFAAPSAADPGWMSAVSGDLAARE